MFKVLEKKQIGSISTVSIEGNIALLKNGAEMFGEKGHRCTIESIGMPHYRDVGKNRTHAEVVISGGVDKIGECLYLVDKLEDV